tara:strand:- start:18062 stop:20287 length:2226 start_codon:yes stop_codon:yes gene_type:complete
MINVILGKKSQLTSELKKVLPKSIIFGSDDFINRDIYKKLPKKFNLIINIFFPSSQLQNIKKYEIFFRKNFFYLSQFLDRVDQKKINKIIFSSSASVYGDMKAPSSSKKLYALSKILAENYLQTLIKKKNKLIIARIFNLYGENENFSIISKILKNKKKNTAIKIFNNGEGIRDFIHAKDVAKIYSKLLTSKIFGIVEVGSGYGLKINNIIKNLKCSKNIQLKKTNYETQVVSIANIFKIKKVLRKINLTKIESFFSKQKIKVHKKFERYSFPNKRNIIDGLPSTIIYGAGYSGKKLHDEILKKSPNSEIYFIDDNLSKHGKFYKQSPILSYESFVGIKKYLNISNLIIAIPSLEFEAKSELLKKIRSLDIQVLTLPNKNEFINKSVFFNDIRKLNPSDFLNRKISEIDNKLIKYLNGSVVLVTGGAGSIGSEIARQISKIKIKKIILFDNNETSLFRTLNTFANKKKVIPVLGDINDEFFLKKTIKKFNVNHIFHAAAYKHVNILEGNIINAVKNNILGTLSLLRSMNADVKSFTFISTDKAAHPKNNLGITKRFSEILCFYYIPLFLKKTKLTVVRFGNVFASNGSAVELFVEQIQKNLPLTITSKNVERFFMSTKEASNLVLQSVGLKSFDNSVFVLNMGKPIRIIDLAKNILKFFNKKNYPIKITGLKKGEKISEKISLSQKIYKTFHKDIFITREKKYSNSSIKILIEFLKKNLYNEYKTKKYLRKFLKFEIKNLL